MVVCVCSVATDDDEVAENNKNNAEENVKEVEQGWMGKRLQPSPILWLIFSGRSSAAIFSVVVFSSTLESLT